MGEGDGLMWTENMATKKTVKLKTCYTSTASVTRWGRRVAQATFRVPSGVYGACGWIYVTSVYIYILYTLC